MTPRAVIILEINEVPWRVFDLYLHDSRFPNLTKFFQKSHTFTTISHDAGELSPWITWPSFHRGLNNTEHGVKFLGQDPNTFRGRAIWQEYRDQGLSIGICGSLQSWPPIDPGRHGFYLPDTFAQDAQCYPAHIQALQAFNLSQVKQNGRVINSRSLGQLNPLGIIKTLYQAGISAHTVARIVKQLSLEKLYPHRLARRPIFQGILFWDVFKRLYQVDNPPHLSTFFTNHIASIMHRYWHHIFPEDFTGDYLHLNPIHRSTLDYGFRILDQIIADTFKLQEKVPHLMVVLATSMGQAKIKKEGEGIEAAVTDLRQLISCLGFAVDNIDFRLAMVPQVALALDDVKLRKNLKQVLESCQTASGKFLFTIDECASSLSITIHTPPKKDIGAEGFTALFYPSAKEERQLIAWSKSGISFHEVEVATAYHIPEGVLAVHRSEQTPQNQRSPIALSKCKNLILNWSGLQ